MKNEIIQNNNQLKINTNFTVGNYRIRIEGKIAPNRQKSLEIT